MTKRIFILVLFTASGLQAGDTLYTHPEYPPIVCSNTDYNFYKYAPKFVPKNLLHSFVILSSYGYETIELFRNRTEDQVLEHGIFTNDSRLRTEFCFAGYSSFTLYFHDIGIYYPYAMESFVLVSFHQYLNQQTISLKYNRKLVLDGNEQLNKAWKKRSARISKRNFIKDIPARKVKRDKKRREKNNPDGFPDERYLDEFGF